jgi:hypothetical protein
MSFLRGSAKMAVFSSGQDYIYIPKEDFEFLGALWEDKIATINCEKKDFCYMKNTTCADLYQLIGPFKIQLGSNNYFSVEPETYLIDGANFNIEGGCVLGIFGH